MLGFELQRVRLGPVGPSVDTQVTGTGGASSSSSSSVLGGEVVVALRSSHPALAAAVAATLLPGASLLHQAMPVDAACSPSAYAAAVRAAAAATLNGAGLVQAAASGSVGGVRLVKLQPNELNAVLVAAGGGAGTVGPLGALS